MTTGIIRTINEDEYRALVDACNLAMLYTVKARIPECGEFGAIAQNLSYIIDNMKERDGNESS